MAVRDTARNAGPGLAATSRWTAANAASTEAPWDRLKSVIAASLDRFRPARDRDHAGARYLDQAERLHQVDEGVQLLGRAGHLEDKGFDRRIDHPRAEDVGDAQGF